MRPSEIETQTMGIGKKDPLPPPLSESGVKNRGKATALYRVWELSGNEDESPPPPLPLNGGRFTGILQGNRQQMGAHGGIEVVGRATWIGGRGNLHPITNMWKLHLTSAQRLSINRGYAIITVIPSRLSDDDRKSLRNLTYLRKGIINIVFVVC